MPATGTPGASTSVGPPPARLPLTSSTPGDVVLGALALGVAALTAGIGLRAYFRPGRHRPSA